MLHKYNVLIPTPMADPVTSLQYSFQDNHAGTRLLAYEILCLISPTELS